MSTTSRRVGEVARGLLALMALTLMVVGIPVALLLVGSTGETSSVSRLTGPDDGTLFFAAVTVIAWVAWLVLLTCLALEVSSLVRGLPAPRMPALGSAQQAVAALVAAVTLLLSGGGGLSGLVVKPMGVVATAVAVPVPPIRPVAVVESTPALPLVEVRRHDTLWSLAERHLGSGERWRQIFDLNRGLPQADGRQLDSTRWILPGWQLRLTADAASVGHQAALHVVTAGETLSEIAQVELGSAARASALFAANEGRTQVAGGVLRDPDLIQPGWELVVPTARTATPPQARPNPAASTVVPPEDVLPPQPAVPREPTVPHEPVVPNEPAVPHEPAMRLGPAAPVQPSDPSSHVSALVDHNSAAERSVDDAGDESPVEGIAGVALSALTAAGLLLEVRRRRRRQQRFRGAGRRIAMPEPDVAALEHQIAALETPQSIATTLAALRALAQSCVERGRPLPDVLLVRVGARSLRLELASDDLDTVPPFAATSPRLWILTSQPGAVDLDDPYPACVALGSADDEMLLLNLEALGALHLADVEGDVRRALVADLAVGPFAASAPLTFVDCFPDVPTALDPGRARVVSTVEQARREADVRVREQADQLASAGGVRTARTSPTAGESLPPEVYVANGPWTPEPAPWSGVVLLVDHVGDEGWSLTVGESGQARLEPHGLKFAPQRLKEDDFARIFDLLRTWAQEEAAPPPTSALQTCLDVAVALPKVPSTVLDLRPGVPAPPRVLLLGRVEVENAIDEAAPHRRRRAAELVAYLALHPGASGGELDEALWAGRRVEKTTRNPFVSRARQWLGRSPDGEPYLPLVTDGGTYRLRPEVSCDWHDFVRFAELGTETQLPNASALAAALDLVRGRPFLGVDPTTYTWSEADTQEMISAIVDVAHTLAMFRLEEGDVRGAREAVAKGLLAEPCSELLYQDAIKAALAAGDRTEVERLAARLRHEIDLIDPDESLSDETIALLKPVGRPDADAGSGARWDPQAIAM